MSNHLNKRGSDRLETEVAEHNAPAFETWTYGGIKFLSFPTMGAGGAWMVIDEQGRNYGSWMTVERFRQLQGIKAETTQPMTGSRVTLGGRVESIGGVS